MQQPMVAEQPAAVPFRFTGRAGEYFGIWIVNLCLTILTLGIYSPWAKVRRKRYFHGNTLLGDAAFEYLADPVTILKGRILVLGALAFSSLFNRFVPLAGAAFTLVLLAALPWVVNRALAFNARNAAHRGVRFAYRATYWETLRLFLVLLLVPLTLGLAYPYWVYRRRRFFVEHSAWGAQACTFEASAGDFYRVYLKVFGVGLLCILGSVVTFGVGLLPLYLFGRAYEEAAVARLAWGATRIGALRIECAWRGTGLFALYVVNGLAIAFSFGLAIPWAAIRAARYRLETLSVAPAGALETTAAGAREEVGALGEEAGEILGFDFGL